ncbi:MAG: hypothetical protein GEV08_20135, partial [Acidimicrobiia bacterium]|nr:hypothetical protein [Acidimicrobiia bacterium]
VVVSGLTVGLTLLVSTLGGYAFGRFRFPGRDALFLLVLPQLPLTMTSSCIATADAAHAYYGRRAWRVRPSALAQTIGGANLVGGLTGAMAMCHGSGGVSAHHVFGARTWRAPVIIGVAMLSLGVLFGQNVVAWISVFPLPLLAGLLGVVAVTHLRLVSGLPRHQQVAALVLGICGFHFGVAYMVVGVSAGLALRYGLLQLRSRRSRPTAQVAAPAGSDRRLP